MDEGFRKELVGGLGTPEKEGQGLGRTFKSLE